MEEKVIYFDETLLNDNILDALYDMRFEVCTPIQNACIDPIIEGRDIMGVAQTGTGKTAAYLLPVLSRLDDGDYPGDAVNCLIMSPTRELAQQIDQAMQGFGYYLKDISSLAVYGGNDGGRYDQELAALRKGAAVVIATPGRLISHMQMGNLDLSRLSFFILDEADRMLDMGFSDDILTIAKKIPSTCQTIMFSATMPEKIEALAKTLLKDPLNVKIAVSKPAEKIKQSAFLCYPPQKLRILGTIFKKDYRLPDAQEEDGVTNLQRVIIFSGKKQRVKDIAHSLKKMKINCGEMHSDLTQAERDAIMFKFKSGEIDVLVATDIVARGIDIDDIRMVINYDVPHDVEDYVHRIGRTARADRDGIALTLVSPEDFYLFKRIEEFLEKEIKKNPLPTGFDKGPDYNSQPGETKKDKGNAAHKSRGKQSRTRKSKEHNNKPKKSRRSSNKQSDEQGEKTQKSKHYDRKSKRVRTSKEGLPHNSERQAD